MIQKNRTVIIVDDGSDAIVRFEPLLKEHAYRVRKVLPGKGFGRLESHQAPPFLFILRYSGDADEHLPDFLNHSVLLILPDPPPESIPEAPCLYGLLDESSSDWVVLNMVERAFLEQENSRIRFEKDNLTKGMVEETYKELLDGMNESVWVIDFEGRIIDVNRKAEKMLGYSRDELLERGLPGIDGRLEHRDILRNISLLHEDKIQVFETVHVARNGRRIPVEVSSSVIRFHGKPSALSIARDISDRKEAEEQLREQLRKDELVVKAMHHRIKNNLATVANLLSLQARISHSDEVQEVLNEAVGRVQCIGLLYNKLLETTGYEGVSVETYFSGIIDSLLDIYPEKRSLAISYDMGDILLEEKYLFPLGVIIEELFTNIFKYGYPGTADGEIFFTGKKEGRQVVFTIRDDGQLMKNKGDGMNQKGFGMMIVNLLCKQINADYIQSVEQGNYREIRFSCT